MTMATSSVDELRAEIERAEEAYEFLIAYAGKGVDRTQPAGTTDEVRDYLDQLSEAMADGHAAAEAVPEENDIDGESAYASFLETLDEEIAEARTVIELVAAQDAITSTQVDDMNGMSVFQSVMMKFFLLDDLTAHL